ncbi:uncharacterized protein LOC112495010 [Cephus cinctus]|uniref:Uncharacterized protein LOC112495010 n=1 Tax=Cephus cinctus TaxID=211228 RepID=A0AAJ7W5E3_CEPCN|nr:uncharacterized protein LOC112495010 [Cephus cinctus]XP_024945229.1 uncharacterized protein LOC112495010 [Cephus cinctus]
MIGQSLMNLHSTPNLKSADTVVKANQPDDFIMIFLSNYQRDLKMQLVLLITKVNWCKDDSLRWAGTGMTRMTWLSKRHSLQLNDDQHCKYQEEMKITSVTILFGY